MALDQVYEHIGQFGLYQKLVITVLIFNTPLIAWLFLESVFILHVPDHRCAIPGYLNDTYALQDDFHQLLINRTIPHDDVCHVFPADVVYDADNRPINASTVKCDSWVYDKSIFTETLAAKLNLVCDQKIYKANAQMIFFGGVLIGSLLMGLISDRIGRRLTCCISSGLVTGAAIAIAWSVSYLNYVILSFLVGFFAAGNFMPLFVIAIELVGPKMRKDATMPLSYANNAGYLILGLMAYLIRDWFYLQLAIAIPGLLMTLNWILLPESPRWLFSQGRYEDTEKILRKIAKTNKKTYPDGYIQTLAQDKEEPKGTLLDLFSTKVLALRTIIIFINWIVVCMMFYGLALNSGNIGGNMFLNFTLNNAVNIPSAVLAQFLLDRTGRKPFLISCMVFGGVACISTVFPVLYGGEDLQIVTTVLSLVGKMGASAGFLTIYIFSAELFPTVVRNAGMGASSSMARVGGMVAPYLADLGNLVESDFGRALPLVVFGCLSVFAGLLVTLLPETLNKHLPETIEDADRFGRDSMDDKGKIENGVPDKLKIEHVYQ